MSLSFTNLGGGTLDLAAEGLEPEGGALARLEPLEPKAPQDREEGGLLLSSLLSVFQSPS